MYTQGQGDAKGARLPLLLEQSVRCLQVHGNQARVLGASRMLYEAVRKEMRQGLLDCKVHLDLKAVVQIAFAQLI